MAEGALTQGLQRFTGAKTRDPGNHSAWTSEVLVYATAVKSIKMKPSFLDSNPGSVVV